MNNIPIHNKRIFNSIITLSNANQLVSDVSLEIAGDLIGNRINGARITSSLINILAQARFKEHLKGLKENVNK